MAIERAIRLLLMVAEQEKPLHAQELAERSGLPLSTTYRYLEHFRRQGLIMQVATAQYSLGPRALQFSLSFERSLGLTSQVLERLHRLAERSEETVALVAAIGTRAVCLESVDSRYGLRYSFRRGSQLPLVRGASAKALLPLLSPETVQDVMRQERLSLQEQANLLREIASIQERGYVETEGEVDVGVWAIGAPIWRSTLRVPTAVSIIAPVVRVTERRKMQLRDLLLRAVMEW
uniref:IclR family transcriptional regulator n=1 Tax=Thermomicrobium roseum TaxID=500 RepID=A0A7C5RT61_THERO